MAERTRGTVRLARGVILRWGWAPGHDDGECPRVGWQVECHETILLYGRYRCSLARAEQVALRSAQRRLATLADLLREAELHAAKENAWRQAEKGGIRGQ